MIPLKKYMWCKIGIRGWGGFLTKFSVNREKEFTFNDLKISNFQVTFLLFNTHTHTYTYVGTDKNIENVGNIEN